MFGRSASVVAALVFAAVPAAAQAQWTPGQELAGHTVRIETSTGIVNTVQLNRDGTARMTSADGAQAVDGNWFVSNQMICLQAASAQECWPYQAPFEAGSAVSLTSDCSITSRWTALSTNPVQRAGERG